MRVTSETFPRTWWHEAQLRGVVPDADGSVNGGALAVVGIAIINGCPGCGATVAPYNSYYRRKGDPYAYCGDCAPAELSADVPVLVDPEYAKGWALTPCPGCSELVPACELDYVRNGTAYCEGCAWQYDADHGGSSWTADEPHQAEPCAICGGFTHWADSCPDTERGELDAMRED